MSLDLLASVTRPRCMYPGCNEPVFVDPAGAPSLYCGITHRNLAIGRGIAANTLCQNCHTRPVYVEHGRPHSFCGKRCATAYANARLALQPNASSTLPGPFGSGNSIVLSAPSGIQDLCVIEGCDKAAIVRPDGAATSFCSDEHHRLGVLAGLAGAFD
ncbi:hypothetical protein BV25DRAFT_1645296 [Artomyces pyxidatus]|uniref:Uncharacterized protein n=1 Tax=Artomyces pyxidatus TaxID=48021 RepID=A0ACB8SJ21_9AGAM|nr:hypothetical protein BV25DRAFT_1645296 [Artomyces pyxidatus]